MGKETLQINASGGARAALAPPVDILYRVIEGDQLSRHQAYHRTSHTELPGFDVYGNACLAIPWTDNVRHFVTHAPAIHNVRLDVVAHGRAAVGVRARAHGADRLDPFITAIAPAARRLSGLRLCETARHRRDRQYTEHDDDKPEAHGVISTPQSKPVLHSNLTDPEPISRAGKQSQADDNSGHVDPLRAVYYLADLRL
jgi:hypothetical protein